ncbi:plasmid replication protein RepC [Rhizobium rhododendri]|uniref:Plasmid replication protein RepC n=1 Tax=Rhizobium rhododendri TaxID=2506430 RepID=A0ABY8IR81_9HYPH|nr:plasmid replication protein RepC [Rhizobium rhododendri]WFS26219.1 plasmid replication protein RepC [Rhizobium rhododendri]
MITHKNVAIISKNPIVVKHRRHLAIGFLLPCPWKRTRMISTPNSHHERTHRRVSAASIKTDRILTAYRAEKGSGCSKSHPSRTQALQVAKRFASAIGLKAAKIALIDQLFAFTKAVDWSDIGIDPVVWPSNELLARRLGIKISTLKYHLSGLVDVGLICYSDHPTYQRRGRRCEGGHIIEAYGINLSPIAARYRELVDLADAAEFEARQCKVLSYRRTSLRRSIAAIVEAARRELGSLNETWNALLARLDRLRERRAQGFLELTEVVDALEALRIEAFELLEALYGSRDSNTVLVKFRPLQTTAEILDSESCSDLRNCSDANRISEVGDIGARAFEKKPSEAAALREQGRQPVGRDDDVVCVSLSLLRSAFLQLSEMVPEVFSHWEVFRSSGGLLCRLCHVDPQVYHEAVEVLGQDLAIVALALTAERSANGSVCNPGGYLRELVKRSRRGTLRLSRSLFGMAAAGRRVHS